MDLFENLLISHKLFVLEFSHEYQYSQFGVSLPQQSFGPFC